MHMARRILSITLIGLVAAGLSCTSSNTGTSVSTGSSNYDRSYTTPTQSNQNIASGAEREVETGDPPITMMLVSMETGDVYPGEDYFIYAVVDNPRDQEIEYEWSIPNGTVTEVPESERGRLMTLLEEEYATASAGRTDAPIPCSVILNGQYGAQDISMSTPVRLGPQGIREIIELEPAADEKQALQHSIAYLQEMKEQLKTLTAI